MIIYRPSRGTLAKSMEEAIEFNSEQEMKEYIVRQWDNFLSIDDIVIDSKFSNDDRIGWKDTRYVCAKRYGDQDNIALYGVPQCIGMCATLYRAPKAVDMIFQKIATGMFIMTENRKLYSESEIEQLSNKYEIKVQ